MNIEKIAAVRTGRYPLYIDDTYKLLKGAGNNPFLAIIYGYQYGFMRGQNAAKANARKKKAVKHDEKNS